MNDLPYLTTRLRAMRGRLLDAAAYRRILALPDLPAMIAFLREGPYGRFIAAAPEAASDAEKIEEALRRDFSATLGRLFVISAGEAREAVQRLVGYWELQNLKTIARGKGGGSPPEEILASLVPTGLHDEAALQEMIRQPTLRAVADLLLTWRDPYGPPLSHALKEYREPRDLFLLEAALDRFYFEEAFRALKAPPVLSIPQIREAPLLLFLGLLADKTNLMTALKGVEEQISPAGGEPYFIPGGAVYRAKDFARLLTARSPQEAAEMARRSVFDAALKDLEAAPGGVSFLSMVERRLDRLLLRKMRAPSRSDPLGIGAVVSYLLDKTRELTNLRMIFRARWARLPEPDLMRLLILE